MPDKYDPADKYTWKEGDLVLLKKGTGKPIISEEELDQIIRENNKEDSDDKSDKAKDSLWKIPRFPKG